MLAAGNGHSECVRVLLQNADETEAINAVDGQDR